MSGGSAQPNHIEASELNLNQLEGLRFLNLPFDTHLAILSFVSPRDLIALRKTCKDMAEVISLRTVWLNALMRMCFENCAITHSFPVSKMSRLELEYAAMGPERLVAAMTKAHSQQLTFLPPSKVHMPLRPSTSLASLCTKIFLVPGGRYLLTLCRGVIAIWDLLNTSEFPTEPLATVPGYSQYFTANPSSDGLGIRLCVTKYIADSPTFAWDICYEIHSFIFTEERPTFHKIGSLVVTRNSDNYFTSMCGDRLVLVDGSAVKVWNFVTDEWATWLTVISPYQIIVSGDIVVLIGRKGITLWDIPPLRPNAQASFTEPCSTVLPRLSINYSDFQNPGFLRELECTGTCDWYTGSIHSLWFDLYVKAQGARLSPFNRYEIQLAYDDPSSSTLRPTRKHYVPIPLESPHSPYRVCGDKAFMWWSTQSAIECTVGPTTEEDVDQEDYRITLSSAVNSGRRQATVCPISGRLCYVCHNTDSIKIVDFLATPTSPTTPILAPINTKS